MTTYRESYRDSGRRGLYRSRRGVIFGVCRGLGEYLDISVFWLRVIVILLFIFTGFFPIVVVYALAGLLMKPEPRLLRSETPPGGEERDFYEEYASSRARAADRLRRTRERLDKRLQRLESLVTSKEFEWEKRFRGER